MRVITLTGLPQAYSLGAATTSYSKPLVTGIVAGAGALVGLLVARDASKKTSRRLLGAGIGAGVGLLLLGMTWPKAEA